MALVAVIWLTLAIAYGLFFSFSVFFVPLIEEFRWSRGLTAGALSLSTIVQGLAAPLTGVLVDRVGPRRVILGGVVALGTASILAARIQQPWHLYVCTGVLGALGLVAVGWVPMGVLLARRFSERRGRMVGLAFSGMGVGVFVMGPLSQWLIATTTWRTATTLLGGATLAILLPVIYLGTRDASPAPRGRGSTSERGTDRARLAASPAASRGAADATLRGALATPAFWWLFAAYFTTPLAVFPVATHSVAFAVDMGFSAMTAAWAFGAMGLLSTIGRVGFGLAADRVGGPLAATLSFVCTAGGALALLALQAWAHGAWLAAFAVLFGLGFGARGPIITAMATDLFGGRRFGVIYGALNLANGFGAALGPWFGGVVHDVTGSYRGAFLAALLFSAVGSACFWLARPRAA
jgi:MFS family permease